jgi:phage terminase small subunit
VAARRSRAACDPLLTVMDMMPLADYCHAYSQWRTAVELLQQMAQNNPVTKGLLVKTTTRDVRRNPVHQGRQ